MLDKQLKLSQGISWPRCVTSDFAFKKDLGLFLVLDLDERFRFLNPLQDVSISCSAIPRLLIFPANPYGPLLLVLEKHTEDVFMSDLHCDPNGRLIVALRMHSSCAVCKKKLDALFMICGNFML